MFGQTISLFRYLLLGILNRRLFILLTTLLLIALLASRFVAELAMINSEQIAVALLADFLRYSLVLLALLMITSNVAEDFESRQFERLLTMPLARWQYIAAQCLVIICIASILCLPVFALFLFVTPFDVALYWSLALWLEISLVGLLGLLAIISLEKIPPAMFFALGVYLLAKFSTLITQMLGESVMLSDGSALSRFSELIFTAILFVIPRMEAFASNEVFFDQPALVNLLFGQMSAVAVFALFVVAVCSVDFYRKEFNR